jgi:hypothetical protein
MRNNLLNVLFFFKRTAKCREKKTVYGNFMKKKIFTFPSSSRYIASPVFFNWSTTMSVAASNEMELCSAKRGPLGTFTLISTSFIILLCSFFCNLR